MRLHSFEAFKAWVDPDDANLEVPLVWTLSLSVPRLQVGGRHKKRIRGEAEKHVTGDELDAWVKQGASIVLSHDLI